MSLTTEYATILLATSSRPAAHASKIQCVAGAIQPNTASKVQNTAPIKKSNSSVSMQIININLVMTNFRICV